MLVYGGVAVVLLDAPSDFHRNVYGVDSNGRTLWRLQKSTLAGKERNDSYVELYKREREVRVFSWMGQVYDVEPRTGKISGSYWTK
jgi:hypothetical protein